ncbi:hypothetical protein TWF569_008234 [Orbilia oligospora]|uniref:Uncharacterized protein n=1 Tax=Orbilia oligospora TaxID=2813651 RepID=A0A7C8J1Q2_ORBOL|nr:hypothetical protein TWF102_010312 [Orbilia oligospora]KAF3108838.1 hypothetical protein TWF103_005430 [Orbilia oligospora]KAF3140476.1 hypothetical protein TWF569_008234 [Orbilia oligospora]KAF3177704.1 hypothetical protein TWF751_002394 [Orbilia oligospora]KAF3193277.1 hypothetical protein TWF225_010046 [Orbilia oligospora]
MTYCGREGMTRSNSYPCFLLVVGLTKLDGVPTGVRRSNHTVLLFLCDRVLRLACGIHIS